ncbi:MAG TPA: hypothetical protein DCQ32_11270 [Cyanobacteria bacterium UBA8156]|nr:hypothetical protein [Cyanobacteria bacterium UBA8156]
MSDLLQTAIVQIQKLPESQQDSIATWLLAKLQEEEVQTTEFSKEQGRSCEGIIAIRKFHDRLKERYGDFPNCTLLIQEDRLR